MRIVSWFCAVLFIVTAVVAPVLSRPAGFERESNAKKAAAQSLTDAENYQSQEEVLKGV